MHISSISMTNFMSHADTRLELPEHGLVLVTGPNGSGKSSLCEAVSYAFWGKSLRGTDPWTAGVVGQVAVESDLGTATRHVTKGGSKKAEWDPTAEAAVRIFDTSSKASDAIEQVVGEHDVWRRTHVFSSADAAHFTGSTDGERKALLEELLHLDCFDRAWERCRADAKVAETELQKTVSSSTQAVDAQNYTEACIATLKATPEEPEPQLDHQAAVCLKEAERLASEGDRLSKRGQELQQRRADLMNDPDVKGFLTAEGAAEGDLRQANRHLSLVTQGTCSQCQQPIDASHRRQAQERFDAAVLARDEAKAARESSEHARQILMDNLNSQIQKVEEAYKYVAHRQQALIVAQREHDRWAADHQAWLERQVARKLQRDKLEDRWQDCDDALTKAVEAERAARAKADELTVVSNILGLKGVRAHVLGQALGGIEAVANAYLIKICQRSCELKLKAYTESKSGNTQDKISLEVVGAGGGYGYKAASGGERRRIDTALLLALAEVAGAASGRAPGTLWLDEVLDSLDSDGVDAVAEALQDLAKDRAVVLITHQQALADRVPAALRLKVEGGRVT